MCMLCGESTVVDIMIIDKDSSRIYCPNCIYRALYNKSLNLCNNSNLRDDITGEYGAILYVTHKEEYCLKRDTMIRLICHNLKPEEWKALTKKYVEPTGTFKFMLHEDFYDDEGNTLQPTILEDLTKTYEVYDVDWIISEEEIMERIQKLSPEKRIQSFGPIVSAMSNTDLTYFIYKEPGISRKLCELPETITIPDEVVDVAIDEQSLSVVTDYLADTFGYFINGYKISQDLKNEIKVFEKHNL